MKLNYKNIYTTILGGILVGIIILTFGGCNEENRYPGVDGRYPGVDGRYPVKNETISDNSSDFVLIKKQTFYDESAYDNVRNVYILKDRVTGKEYIGISGIGISERGSHVYSKSIVPDER